MIMVDDWLCRLRTHLESIATTADEESVHQVRVATRRIGSWLELGGRRVLRDDLRWLRRQAAAVRDLDVLVARDDLPKRLQQDWTNAATAARTKLRRIVRSTRTEALLAALGSLPGIDEAGAKARLGAIREMVVRRGDKYCASPGDLVAMHRLRRGVRRLRYALEWIDEDTKPLRRLQEVLGMANDAALALARASEGEGGGTEDFRARLADQLEERRAVVLSEWKCQREWVERQGV